MSTIPQNAEPTQVLNHEIASAVSQELHQTAQPLTVLQGLLELSLLKSGTIEEYRSSLERAINELHRVVAGFDHVRELIHSTQLSSQLQSAALPPAERTAQHV
jgi:signal transduction histidine kinase